MFIKIATRNLVQGGRRTALLSLAIALVCGLLVLLSALAAGLEGTMIRSASTLMSGHVNIGGFFKVTATQPAPLITEVARLRTLVETRIDGVDLVIDRSRGWGKVISDTGSFHAGLTGVDITEERRLVEVLQPVSEGAQPSRVEDLAEPNTIVIFESQAKRLGVGVGDALTLTAQTGAGIHNTADVRVVAVVRDVGYLSAIAVFLPKETVRNLYQLKADTSGAVQIYLKDPELAPVAMAQLREVLVAEGFELMPHDPRAFFMKFEKVAGEDWTGQRLDLTTWRDEVSYMLWILTGFATLRWLLLGTLMVIIVVGIMNAMWMSIRERTREVGTLRAIGMSKRQVLLMFLLEGALLGFAAATVGGLSGAFCAWGLDVSAVPIPLDAFRMVMMSDTLHLQVKALDVLTGIGIVTGVTTLAALFPAWRAARLRPVTAIHHVG